MNCKQGDLAIVVKSNARNEGKIVTCLEYVFNAPGGGGCSAWRVDIPLNSPDGRKTSYIIDNFLKPLPPEDDVKSFDTTKELELVHGK